MLLTMQGLTFEFEGGNSAFKVQIATPNAEHVLQTFRELRRGLGTGFKDDVPQFEGPANLGFSPPPVCCAFEKTRFLKVRSGGRATLPS